MRREQRFSVYYPPGTEIYVPHTEEPVRRRSRRAPPGDRPSDRAAKAERAYRAAHKSQRRKLPERPSPQRRTAPWWKSGIEEEKQTGGEPKALTVPPEILALAQDAAKHWQMSVRGMTLAATKPEKGWGAIWRIETDRGPRSLKLLHRPFARNLFSIHAQEYLTKQRARVAPLVRTRSGELQTIVGGRMFIVTDWIEGLHPASKVTVEGAAALCRGLGEFHRLSRGYRPPPEAHYASRIHRWPGVYQKMRTKIDWFEHLARAYSDMPASQLLLRVLPRFRKQADEALERLQRSAYGKLVARGEESWGLVHQDYGWSNGQLGPDGKVWIIDLDGVAFDLTFRDLRKLITGTMDDRGDWDLAWMSAMIKAYGEANPLEPQALQVMLIDMLLPNEFYKLVKDALFEPTQLNAAMARQLERLLVTDEHKQRALAELGLGRS